MPVSNTPGDYAEAVAEQAIALLLAVSKHVVEGDRFMRQGKYKAWDPLLLLGDDARPDSGYYWHRSDWFVFSAYGT